MTRSMFAAAASLAAVLVACGGEGDLRLSGTTSAGAGGASAGHAGSGGSSAGAGGTAGSGAGGTAGAAGSSGSSGQGGAGQAGAAGAPIRTVTQRNPFGHVEQTDNLLWDGDFEWTGPFVQQYAWASGKSWQVSGAPTIRVDPACRSGLKCAFVKKQGGIGSVAVSPTTPTTHIHGWARVAAGTSCSKVSIYLSQCFGSSQAGKSIEPVSSTADASSWCEYDGESTTLDQTPCLFVVNKTFDEIVVDDMYLGPGKSTSAPPSSLIGPEDQAAIDDIRAVFRDRRQDPRPPARPKPLVRAPRVR